MTAPCSRRLSTLPPKHLVTATRQWVASSSRPRPALHLRLGLIPAQRRSSLSCRPSYGLYGPAPSWAAINNDVGYRPNTTDNTPLSAIAVVLLIEARSGSAARVVVDHTGMSTRT